VNLATTSDFVFTPFGLHLPLDTETVCVDLTGEDTIIFGGLLIKDWKESTISSSWSSSERGLIIFCIVMYFILFFYAFVNFVLHVLRGKFAKFPAPVVALTCVCVLAALGAAQLLSVYVGTVTGNQLSPLLSDLQSLMLISCVVLIVITWSDIIISGKQLHTGRSSYLALPLLYLMLLYWLFVALLVASSATVEDVTYTCATTDDEKEAISKSQALAIAYKAILACWAFLLACVFAWMSWEIFALLRSYKKLADVVIKNLIASVTVILALLVLVAITLYSTQNELENTTKLAFTITVLLLPSYSITYLYSLGSSFTTWKRWSSSKKPSRSSPSSPSPTSVTV